MELLTSRLRLRPLNQQDWPLFQALNQNPEVMKFVADIQQVSEIKANFDLRCCLWHNYSNTWLTLVIERQDTGEPIGLHGFKTISDTPAVAELGFMLCPNHQGQGFAFEASMAVIENAFKVHHYDTLIATVTKGNTASEQLLYKLGFKVHQVIERNYMIGGNLLDDIELVLNKPAAKKRHPA
ncbi:GNAT family N-acetyltransferase [Pseudoalteromonas luteoviolacea]|uniref:GNAT family N-acetyltransferase n=1 Tax=Pseudoalteromonas luteoviolacea TaxID=43657 RepID=UPI001B3618DC|nr:GNAT family N-acetyltransferase [Pseudoalteromonas luteoviolacea]MBQ4837932.1 GNAT family N-acetyltransferase [Pseudoalteromonas luteoviolacea]